MDLIEYYGPPEKLTVICVSPYQKLRVGVFFDGTGNHTENSDTWSNICKLCMAYKDHIYNERIDAISEYEPAPCTKIYKRGVGTDKDNHGEVDDMSGNGFGLGINIRLKGALNDLLDILNIFKKNYDTYPKYVYLDVFGFSRGAATARHFCNIMLQNHFKLSADKAINDINFSIKFLGIFDTVGSVGLAGNSIEPGYSLHVDKKVEKTVHLIAEDEYRANFDLTSACHQDTDYPFSITINNVEEILIPGAHSDVGGGYSSKLEHDVSNNHLAKIALKIMYEKGLKEGVPFLDLKDIFLKEKRLEKNWQPDQTCEAMFINLKKFYDDYSGLRVLYKQWRETDLTMKAIELMSDGKTKTGKTSYFAHLIGESTENYNIHVSSHFRNLYKRKIHQILGNLTDSFFYIGDFFYNNYVHKSCFPWNPIFGMWPQSKEMKNIDKYSLDSGIGEIFHREIHLTEYVKLKNLKSSSLRNVRSPGTLAGYVINELFDHDVLTPKPFDNQDHGLIPKSKKR